MKNILKTLNSVLNRGNKKLTISHLNTPAGKITNKEDIASTLNTFFSNIGSEPATKLQQPSKPYTDYLTKSIACSFSFKLTTPDQVSKIINAFKPKTSSGHDGFSMKMLKQLTKT